MPAEFPGWLSLAEAVEQYGIPYERLRRVVRMGIFTRGRFTSEKDQAPIFLKVEELDAWKAGGIDAVRAVQLRAKPDADEPVPTHETGENGGA